MPKSFARVPALFAAFGLLAGCSSVESFLPHGDPNASAIALGANPPKTAQPGANPSEKPTVRPVASVDINCPPVDVAEDGAAYRVGGAESASVRYQFNIGDTARQCDPAGPGQASIKVGVKGDVVIGPAGSAGTYSVPLKSRRHARGRQEAGLLKDLQSRGDHRRRHRRGLPARHRARSWCRCRRCSSPISTRSASASKAAAPPRRTATGATPPVSRACVRSVDKARPVGLARLRQPKTLRGRVRRLCRRRRRRNRPGNAQASGPRGDDALESGVGLIEPAPTDGGNRRNGGKSLRSWDRGGACGPSAVLARPADPSGVCS